MLSTVSPPTPPSPSNHAPYRAASDEFVVRLGRAASGVRVVARRDWPQLRYAELTFAGDGEACLPTSRSYLVVAAAPEHHASRDELGDSASAAPSAPAVPKTMFVRGAAPPCRYAWQAGHRAIFVRLDPSIVAAAALDTGMRTPLSMGGAASIAARDHVCTHLLQVLRAEAGAPMHATQKRLMDSIASALALRLLVQFTATSAVGNMPRVAGELTARRFARVRDYIEHNLGEAITLEDLAHVAGVSRFHFARQFRARTGESPMGYLLRTRVDRAKMLLRDSRTRVIDISAELGFADQSHFARTFRRLVGMPPSAYARAANGR